ncbi:Argonaute/Dicer protein, PAZ domain-containing protein [Rozella allomycis CSF55]|uniref:Argonaute/Dicer protein, PAZ domain-containing protein n=1 Tax=Rozella allomycis (strain CSF55) TaxID=988480 RepID=A0A075AN09_ROZAC|nr:Argonaute/Dicer protein, PAZ domain-containing protein [Rozella allomycis CSF55]|eukprot:EPZ31159.1 Argonaute/Dicer protein, PAZ domain-containing protein [Rozella allomycis CSF55]
MATTVPTGALSSLTLSDLPKRPDYGKVGKKIRLRANMLKIPSFTNGTIYHYDVNFVGVRSGERRIFTEFLAQFKEIHLKGISVAFDGKKNLYTSAKINRISGRQPLVVEFTIQDGARKKDFKIEIKHAADVNMAVLHQFFEKRIGMVPQECIQALDVIIKQGPSVSGRYTLIGSSMYMRENPASLGSCIEVWPGIFLSVRATQSGLVLNADTANNAFLEPLMILDCAAKVVGARSASDLNCKWHPDDIKELERKWRGTQVQVTHSNIPRKYKIFGIKNMSVREIKFKMEDGTNVSVYDYFQNHYNKKLEFDKCPCLAVGPEGKTFLPMEVCKIVQGQQYRKKLNEEQTTNMLAFATLKPEARFNRIRTNMAPMVANMSENLKGFGINLSNQFLECEGRVLDPPVVHFGANSTSRPSGGVWNMKDKKLNSTGAVESWAVVSFDNRSRPDKIYEWLDEFGKVARSMGMDVKSSKPPVLSGRPNEVKNVLRKAIDDAERMFKKPCQFLLCIMPPSGVYEDVKKIMDCEFGKVSQCMKGKHIGRPNGSYMANLLLKINSKMGGVNFHLDKGVPFILQEPTLVFGADVTHPAPGENSCSIAAVVGSTDPKVTRFVSSLAIQGSRVEIIDTLKDMAKNIIMQFRAKNRILPRRIIFYRDGVSEGQFNAVRSSEISALKRAFGEIEKDYNPKLLFIVVQKRHHVRFMADRADCDRSGNVPAGTVVDKEVTAPDRFEFYLNSHAGLQGCSRPSLYTVIWNDFPTLTSDQIQEMTYRMCYTYVRCTRSVSVVPPAYYAHLLAFRARFLFNVENDPNRILSREYVEKVRSKIPPLSPDMMRRMFYV